MINRVIKMKLSCFTPFFAMAFFPTTINACINTYAFDMGAGQIDAKYAKEQLQQKTKPSMSVKTIEELNDYAVMLIYAGEYQNAIKIFENIEKIKPNLAKTAANLGTAYELSGQLEKAKYWIQQGIRRDPNIHDGSEWIHVKILDAQLEQKKDRQWIQTHDVLGLDFGQKATPIVAVKTIRFENKTYDLNRILLDSQVQMTQRLQFIKHDPISAQIIFNMANIEVINYNTNDYTVDVLYEKAKYYGYVQPKLIDERLDYFQNSNWYHFKAKLFNFISAMKTSLFG